MLRNKLLWISAGIRLNNIFGEGSIALTKIGLGPTIMEGFLD